MYVDMDAILMYRERKRACQWKRKGVWVGLILVYTYTYIYNISSMPSLFSLLAPKAVQQAD